MWSPRTHSTSRAPGTGRCEYFTAGTSRSVRCRSAAHTSFDVSRGAWFAPGVPRPPRHSRTTWRRGTRILAEQAAKDEVRLANFIAMLERSTPERVKGVAVFLTGQPDLTPSALFHRMHDNSAGPKDEALGPRLGQGSAGRALMPRVHDPQAVSRPFGAGRKGLGISVSQGTGHNVQVSSSNHRRRLFVHRCKRGRCSQTIRTQRVPW